MSARSETQGSPSSGIPRQYHYIWFGDRLPFFARVAMRSALVRCPEAEVHLWIGPEASDGFDTADLAAHPRFKLERLRLGDELERASSFGDLPQSAIRDVWASLRERAGQANLARLAILASRGGVYLDTDTLVLRDLAPLHESSAFCGLEPVLWPVHRARRRDLYGLVGGPSLGVLRTAMAAFPHGYRWQPSVSKWFSLAANNAVLGMAPGHGLAMEALRRVGHLPAQERTRRYRLGTHLLQELLAPGGHDVTCYPPRYFYPLGPVLSRHYFRARPDVAQAAQEIITADTFVVHWYASVSQLTHWDAQWIQGEGANTLYGFLCRSVLEAP